MPFACSICGEESTQICARCTKDACDNHLCSKCRRCSDCCECEVTLEEPARPVVRAVVDEPEVAVQPETEPAIDPQPAPEQEPELEPEPAPLQDPSAEDTPPVNEPELL